MDREPAKQLTPEEIEERRRGLSEARRILAPYLIGPSLADELLAERRAEAAAEALKNG